jgi:hypothetical protein
MTQRERVEQSLRGSCREVYTPRGIPERYQGRRARLALIELHLREGRHVEAYAMVLAELDGTAG